MRNRLILSLILFFAAGTIHGQEWKSFPGVVRLLIEPANNRRDSIFFGFHPEATYCIDYELGEFEVPIGPPCECQDIRWVDHRSTAGRCLGTGVYPHFQGAVKDTFLLNVIFPEDPYPLIVRWDSISPLEWSSMTLEDRSNPGGPNPLVNMLDSTQASFILGTNDVNRLRIIATRNTVAGNPEAGYHPAVFALHQNYPNPFNPLTEIRYQISEVSMVILKVYDVLGREVATLVEEKMEPGEHTIRWNAYRMPSGMYYCRMQAGSFVATRKIVLLK